MNKHLLAAILTIPAAFLANHAMAQSCNCDPGVRWNGTQLNGLPTPGPVIQGTQINGVPTPGPLLQGTQINGIPTPGPLLQGTQINGIPTPGPMLQGTQINGLPMQTDGIFAGNLQTGGALFQADYLVPATQQAPAWSALPVSRMVVHVAAAL